MAVDRGELRYKIAIEDQFTKSLRNFRSEVDASRRALGDLRAARARSGNSAEERRARDEARAAEKEQIQRLRQLAANQKILDNQQKFRIAQVQDERRERQRLAKVALDAEKAQRREAAATAKAQRQAAAETERAQRRAAAAMRAAAKENSVLRNGILGTADSVNRVAFTFRRLFGILAAFTLARQVVSGFGSLIGGAIQFNRTVEDSQVGLASLLVSAGEVTNEYGELVKGAEAFTIAQREAAIQGNKLRQDALRTTATYEELLVAFQAALGPGLAAGLDPDQVREVAVNISQAAAAFGLEQNQLAEEVRSLITGTGQLRTTRLAQVISNEDIRKAREAGKLFELLTDRLKPFALAADVTQQNFSGLIARLQDAVQLSSGSASVPFFLELKLLLGDLGDLFVDLKRDANGVIESVTPKPQAVAALAIVFDGLKTATETIRAGIRSIDYTQVTNALAALSAGLRAVADIGVGFIRGLISGFSDLAVIGEKVFGGLNSPALREAVALVTRLGVLLIPLPLIVSAAAGAFRLLLAPLSLAVALGKKLLTFAELTLGVIGKLPAKLLPALAAITLIVLGFQKMAKEILGFDVGIKDTLQFLGLTFQEFFGRVTRLGTIAFKTFANQLLGFFQAPLSQIAASFSDLFGGILQLVSGAAAIIGVSEDARANIEAGVSTLRAFSEGVAPPKIFDTDKDRAELDAFLNESQQKFTNLAAELDTRAKGSDFAIPVELDTGPALDGLAGFLAEINAELTGLIGGDIVDEEGIADKLSKLGEDIEKRLGNIFGKSTQEAEKLTTNSFGQLIANSQQYIDLLTNSVRAFASFASDAIVDAFDPTKDVDIRERFARLLQDIAKQVLQTILQLLIATAIAKAFGVPLASPGKETIPALPFADGGKVPDTGPPVARPAGIPKSDTTLAWLTPGEVVQSLDAVRKYGTDFLLALNDGAIDPLALRSLSGLGAERRVRRSVKRSGALSFANGGLVPVQAAQAAATAGGGTATAQPSIALVVGNEQSLDRMLAGGSKAMLDFMRTNASQIDGILSRNRT